MIELTYDRAVEILTEVAASKPTGHTAPTIPEEGGVNYYTMDGEPCCLLGHAFVVAGLTVADLEIFDHPDGGFSTAIPTVLAHLRQTGKLMVTDERTFDLFAIAQSDQDQGINWNDSVADAVKMA